MKDINWAFVAWNKTTKQLSKELGVSISTVSYHRRNLHGRRGARSSWNIDWSHVDWNKPNWKIAAAVLSTPSAVANARMRYAPDNLKIGRDVRSAYSRKPIAIKACEPSVVAVTNNPTPKAQPSWIKRKLISIRDWLFDLCVSFEKEANK